ncbi:amidase signature enzyme [Xylariomycetidae sp. FL2044]|nr:amidase signature enzyme [Xylariomycetidae sp. FL2044]
MASGQRFSGYPRAREGPQTPYKPTVDKNPVLRGWALVIAAQLTTRIPAVAHATWKNAKFGSAKDIPGLSNYDPCLQPIVTPLVTDGTAPKKLDITPELCTVQPKDIPGRFYSALDYHELYKAGKLTPLQVAEHLLPLISRGQEPRAKYESAFTLTRKEAVLEVAKRATERYAQGTWLSVVDGVPFGVKDDIAVEGYTSHFGLPYDKDEPFCEPAKETIWPVAQFEAAGAMLIGKLAMHELGLDVCGCNPHWGTPINWNNPDYYPGGSSSGAGSALSAGIVPIAVGTDAGGSLRIPSSFCGMYGLKPTLHRLDTYKSSICVIGPMAATATDLTIAYRIMSAPNPDDPVQGSFAPSTPPDPKTKKPLGIYRAWFDDASPAVIEATEQAIAYLTQNHNYEVVDISIPYLQEGQYAHSAWALAEGVDQQRSRARDPAQHHRMLTHANQILLKVGACTTAVDLLKGGQLRRLHMEHLAFLYRKKHPGLLILTPTVPDAGWRRDPADDAYGFSDGNATVRAMRYIWLANATGCPALSAPVAYVAPAVGRGRLPVGLMAMAEWGAEEALLAWARDLEGYVARGGLEGGRVRPRDWVDVLGGL